MQTVNVPDIEQLEKANGEWSEKYKSEKRIKVSDILDTRASTSFRIFMDGKTIYFFVVRK